MGHGGTNTYIIGQVACTSVTLEGPQNGHVEPLSPLDPWENTGGIKSAAYLHVSHGYMTAEADYSVYKLDHLCTRFNP